MEDAALLDRACKGDERAFSGLFARYQHSIHHYAERMCGCGGGDDVVQETFLAALRAGGRYDAAKGMVRGYLFGIARHHEIFCSRGAVWGLFTREGQLIASYSDAGQPMPGARLLD